MSSKIGSALVLAFCLASGLSAREVGGRIVDASNTPIQGANVWWLDAKTGTTTDAQGHFRIPFSRESDRLKISYVGYQTDTLSATLFNETNDVQIALNEAVYLEEVQIAGRRPGLVASRITTLKVETITQDELCKAACCNLSESFETNPSVDVSYSDAATGAKQIKLLGLSGTYVQMLSEGIPFIRGLASPYGLSHVPGPWMESIQVSKGAASVINGYEAITGQINVEYKKPMTSDLLSVNLFMADNLRSEVNADWALKLNPYTSTSTFVHYENETREHDANGDGFMDLPAVEQASLLHRWYYNKNGYTSQFAIKGLDETRQSGQTRHGNHAGTSTDPLYRIDLATQRIEAFAKNGYVFNPERNRSVGLITSVSWHDQDAVYGNRVYDASQRNAYANLIWQSDVGLNHKLVAGSSILLDDMQETFGQRQSNTTEVVPGAFAEFAWKPLAELNVLAGLRYDHSSWFGGFVTPRMHVKYDPLHWLHLRANVGKGHRSTRVLSENSFLLASSRSFELTQGDEWQQEIAWNSGLSAQFYIPLGLRELTLGLESYNTDFRQQVVVDVDSDPTAVTFSPLQGTSYANVYQADLQYELLRGLQLGAAFRYTDAKTTYNGILRERPLTSRYKGLFTLSWQDAMKRWQFDGNLQFNGSARLPGIADSYSPTFNIFNAQATRYFRWGSIYVGGENLGNFTQANPILGAEDPWGASFDASQVWGPVHGSKYYVGLRYSIKQKK